MYYREGGEGGGGHTLGTVAGNIPWVKVVTLWPGME